MNQQSINTFQDGMNLDASDMILKNTISRFNLNVRLINLGGSSFVVSNLNGTEVKFQLSSGFVPVATQEHRNILYIVSWNQVTANLEIGSYPSPDPALGSNILLYRPFANYIGGPTVGDVVGKAFRVPMSLFALDNEFPIIQKLEIQPDYDRSSNILFTVRGKKPRIINSKFSAENISSNLILEYTPDRAGDANSNTYTSTTVEKETSTIIYSPKILDIEYNAITSGGKLKPGNYVYVFHYMTEDFNKTNVIGQSSVCQVAFGGTLGARKGGTSAEETTLAVKLNLANIDTDFKFIKVYVLYSSGVEGLEQQYLELTDPLQITSESMTFTHTGYEEMAEVSADTINIDYAIIEGADASTQIGGYYVLGGIKQRAYDFQQFKEAAILPSMTFKVKNLSRNALEGYADPENVYKYMGHFGNETYPYGMVFIMPDASLSPVFPMKGAQFVKTAGSFTTTYESLTQPQIDSGLWYKGLVKYPMMKWYPVYDDATNTFGIKYAEVDMAAIPQNIRDNSLGFFIVRAERKTELLAQGIVVPAMKAPTTEVSNPTVDNSQNDSYYGNYAAQIDDTFRFKRIPVVDNLLEAYRYEEEDTTRHALDEGYMPIYIQNPKDLGASADFYYIDGETTLRHWAFISSDGLLNEPELLTRLNSRDNAGIDQIDKVFFEVGGGELDPLYRKTGGVVEINPGGAEATTSVGTLYEFKRLGKSYQGINLSLKRASKIVYVAGESIAPSGEFISKINTHFFRFSEPPPGNTESGYFRVRQGFNSYFGIIIADPGVNFQNATKGSTNPLAGSTEGTKRPGVTLNGGDNRATNGVVYDNYGREVPAAFLVNIYTSENSHVTTPDQLYPTVDNLVYRQVTKRYKWSDVEGVNSKIDIFGGDCYISKVYRKMYQCGERNAADTTDKKYNINAGLTLSWYQESVYNAYLRQPKRFDASETEDRSFYPYYGDFTRYREYRYPETVAHSPGYSQLTRPKTFIPSPNLAPYIENYYFSRIAHSEKHIPNAFKNGYRQFLETSFKDYDSSMGRIIGMFNHRGRLLVIFESGIGITEVEQRIQTGSDAAGAIFVEPSGVLPTTLQYVSREIGCQDHLSFVQTPSAVYAFDKNKKKIWQFRDTLKVISDDAISSYLVSRNNNNPRSGYDFENNEVLFTTDEYTLCFREGLEKFTSFYSFQPNLYARRNNDMYSFLGSTAWQHNQPNYAIYNEQKNTIVEFVLNQGLSMAKVVDYLNIISNEIAPVRVEFYSYNQEVEVGETIQVGSLNQYARVDDGVDIVTEEPIIVYRDKKFIVQTPVRSDYESGSDVDEWGVEGRIRDKYIIIRLTYNTDEPLELASVISNFRYSRS